MTKAGFGPALVVETSPRNFRGLAQSRENFDRDMSTLAAKELAKRFGGDLSSADWRHFGRLAGFTNRKPERLLPNGLAPFVCLHQSRGTIYYAAHDFLQEVKSISEAAFAERAMRRTCRSTAEENPVRSLHGVSWQSPIRRRFTSRRYGLGSGRREPRSLTTTISEEILHARELSKKRPHSASDRLCGKNRDQSPQDR